MNNDSSEATGTRLRNQSGLPAPITLCMIVKDEERFINGCLKSIGGLVSEIVIVDTGSTDSTLDIISRYGAKVWHYEWKRDFAAARNFGLEKATQPWILYLDADERLYPPHHDAVLRAIQSNKADAFYLRVHSEVNSLLGNVPHVQGYPRLFRKLPGVEFIGRIHEQITPSIRQANGRFALLEAEIEHLGYNLSEVELAQKIQRNLIALQEQVEDEPENVYARFQLGQTLILNNRIEEGIHELQTALSTGSLTNALAATAQLIIANEVFKDGAFQAAISLIAEAIEKAPRQQLGWFLLSECHAHQENYSEAIEALKQLQKHQGLSFSDVAVDKIFEVPLIEQRLGLYYFFLEAWPQAIQHFAAYFKSGQTLRAGLLTKYLHSLQQVPLIAAKTRETLSWVCGHLEVFDHVQEAITDIIGYLDGCDDGNLQTEVLTFAEKHLPDKPEYPYLRGNLYLRAGNLEQARDAYLRSIARDDSVYEVHFNLAIVELKLKNLSAAQAKIQMMSNQFPENLPKISVLQEKLTRLRSLLPELP